MAKKIILIALIVVILAGLGLFFYGRSYIGKIDAAFDAYDHDSRIIEIPAGSTSADIGRILEDGGLIKDAGRFRLFTRIKGYDARFQAGTYAISPDMDLTTICDIIASGKTTSISFTVPEGLMLSQISEKLAAEGLIDRERFDELLRSGDFDYDFLSTAVEGDEHLEGYLFPSTYTLPYGTDEEGIIRTMLDQFGAVYTPELRARAAELGLNDRELVTIASMIEEEARLDSDRALVASVIYNRLEAGMRLQIDATVAYVFGDPGRSITYSDMETESPYNTYVVDGLPAGPISCPGEASIKAALYPAETSYIYYVNDAKLDGSLKFSETYDEFLVDRDAYYAAVEAQG